MPVTLFAVFLTVAWWRQAEGGGYIVQRLGATRSVRDAERASIWFAVLHNAIRPWPWILVALAALVIWPLGSVPAAGVCGELLETCGPGFACVENLCQFDREATYAMLLVEKLPVGALGLVVASLLAAFMSTIDTHVNWGASYLVRDIWERFIHPDASPREQVRVGRIGVLAMAVIAAAASTQMTSIVSVWMFLITLGGGMGAVSIVRWIWWRVNAEAELASLVAATALTIVVMTMDLPKATGILVVAFGSLAVWVPVALFGPKTDEATLDKFYQLARPTGAWGPVAQRNPQVDTSLEKGTSLRILAGFVAVYATLFGIGGLLLHSAMAASLAALLGGLASFYWLLRGAPEDGKAGLP
jgi:Na+/proline symporter